MTEQQEKSKKLNIAKSNLESELRNINNDITDAIDRQDRRIEVERLVSNLKDFFDKLVQKIEKSLTWLLKPRHQLQFIPSLSNSWMM